MITPAEFKRLASLESREVLLAKLAGAMNASMAGAVSLFAAPLAQAARAFAALQATKEKE
jgi:large subunit ribosomal protein L10